MSFYEIKYGLQNDILNFYSLFKKTLLLNVYIYHIEDCFALICLPPFLIFRFDKELNKEVAIKVIDLEESWVYGVVYTFQFLLSVIIVFGARTWWIVTGDIYFHMIIFFSSLGWILLNSSLITKFL